MIIVWSTQMPLGDLKARETLDAALAFAAYDQKVALLFTEEGVRQLVPCPNSVSAGGKNISKLLNALPMFEIDDVLVCQNSLSNRGISSEQLIGTPVALSAQRITELLREAAHVIRI